MTNQPDRHTCHDQKSVPGPSMSAAEAEAALAPLEDAVRADRHRGEAVRDCPTPESHNWGCGCPTDVAAAIASCPGHEMSPSPCRCPCSGCKHHCSAHDPDNLLDDVPAAGQTALRDRIADAIAGVDAGSWGTKTEVMHPYWRKIYQSYADAVLAVLPAPTDQPAVRAATLHEAIPDWEAVYEPGNVSTYLIGYANDQDAATGMAEAWMRSQAEVTGRLEWVDDKQMATGGYDRWFELIERHGGGVDTGPGIVVRRRLADDQPAPSERPDVQHAPGKVICCPDCAAKGYAVCLDEPAGPAAPTKEA